MQTAQKLTLALVSLTPDQTVFIVKQSSDNSNRYFFSQKGNKI